MRGAAKDSEYLPALGESGWLQHVGALLRGALCCALALHSRGDSLLVHCSDGWDRTAQVCVMTQLLLDPHYRTLKGFCQLLDKELVGDRPRHHAPSLQQPAPRLLSPHRLLRSSAAFGRYLPHHQMRVSQISLSTRMNDVSDV